MPYESSLYCQCMRCQEKVVWRNWRPGASPRGGHVHPTFARGDVIPEIDANPVSFFREEGVGVGHGLELHSPSHYTSVR